MWQGWCTLSVLGAALSLPYALVHAYPVYLPRAARLPVGESMPQLRVMPNRRRLQASLASFEREYPRADNRKCTAPLGSGRSQIGHAYQDVQESDGRSAAWDA